MSMNDLFDADVAELRRKLELLEATLKWHPASEEPPEYGEYDVAFDPKELEDCGFENVAYIARWGLFGYTTGAWGDSDIFGPISEGAMVTHWKFRPDVPAKDAP